MSNFAIINEKLLKEKMDMLEALENIEIATNIIKEASGKDDIIDQHYQKLNCHVDYVPENTDLFNTIKTYFENTASDQWSPSNVILQDVYKVKRDQDYDRFTNVGNRMLLWHGSGISNFVGILSQGKRISLILGMRIAPPEAPCTGYNFGKGVYFADMSAKSLNYCRCTNGEGLILLCEVAVGNPKDYFTTCYDAYKLPSGCHSTKGCGKFAPPDSCHQKLEGMTVANGKGQNTNVNVRLYFIILDLSWI